MAGSYGHATTDDGKLRHWTTMGIATENQGDSYETIEEMYGMIWWLAAEADAADPAAWVEEARKHYKDGIEVSPGVETEEEAERHYDEEAEREGYSPYDR
jgi:hypothetical protein